MRDKVIKFVTATVENYRRSIEHNRQYADERGYIPSAIQSQQQLDTLALWEELLNMVSTLQTLEMKGTSFVIPTRRQLEQTIWEGYHPYRNHSEEVMVRRIADLIIEESYVKVRS